MRYQSFQRLRAPTWRRLQRLLQRAQSGSKANSLSYDELEELAMTYRQVMHDYSLASSRYPGTAAVKDLRRLVLEATHFLHRDSASRWPDLRAFVTHGFPTAFRRALPSISITSGLFVLMTVFGLAATLVQPSMAFSFLSSEAIEGVEKGELWTDSIFAVTPGAVASTRIATNNLSVVLTAWGGGILCGLGSLWIIILNGLMLGSVLAFTAQYNLSDELLTFIGAHGPLELGLICVSAGAGLHMGAAMLRATDRPRSVELNEKGRDSLTVLLGCLPFILLLGFVEGYVSPSADISTAAKWLLGLLLQAVFVLWCLMGRRADVEVSAREI